MTWMTLLLASCVNRESPAYTWAWTDEAPLAGVPDLVPGEVVAVFAGDGGKHHPRGALDDGPCTAPDRDAVSIAIQRDVMESSRIFWLGDNVYERAWKPGEDEGSCESSNENDPAKGMAALRRQIATAPQAKHAYFIPGNHDYAQGGLSQRDRVMEQARFLKKEGAQPLAYDQPVEAIRLKGVTVIAYDSQMAVLERDLRPSILAEMDAIVKASVARGDEVVIASHHPVYTVGPHGFASLRARFTSTDLSNRAYASWRSELKQRLNEWGEGVDLVVGGHEHSLQQFRGPHALHVVAGSASKTSDVRGGSSDQVSLEHAERNLGYALLTQNEGRLALELIAVRRDDGPGCVELVDGWFRCRAAHTWLQPELDVLPEPPIPATGETVSENNNKPKDGGT